MEYRKDIGLGTTQFWYGSTKTKKQVFHDAFYEYGVNIIDTAEMYGEGTCEKEVSSIIKELGRNNLYIIDKILPDNATDRSFFKSLHKSLELLETDCIDLYLLHWREKADLRVVVRNMEEAKRQGLIREWGVSNFDVSDMEDLLKIPDGDKCYANEIFYNVFYRGIEYDLLPYLKEHGIRPISYSTLDTRKHRQELYKHKDIADICLKENVSPEALLLAFAVREYDLLALFNTSSPEHLKENMKYRDLDILPYMDILNKYYPAPVRKVPLEKR